MASVVVYIAGGDSDGDVCGVRMRRHAAFCVSVSYAMAYCDGNGHSYNRAITHPKPETDCNIHPQTEADSTAPRAAERV
jgi:hypothetical protein